MDPADGVPRVFCLEVQQPRVWPYVEDACKFFFLDNGS